MESVTYIYINDVHNYNNYVRYDSPYFIYSNIQRRANHIDIPSVYCNKLNDKYRTLSIQDGEVLNISLPINICDITQSQLKAKGAISRLVRRYPNDFIKVIIDDFVYYIGIGAIFDAEFKPIMCCYKRYFINNENVIDYTTDGILSIKVSAEAILNKKNPIEKWLINTFIEELLSDNYYLYNLATDAITIGEIAHISLNKVQLHDRARNIFYNTQLKLSSRAVSSNIVIV